MSRLRFSPTLAVPSISSSVSALRSRSPVTQLVVLPPMFTRTFALHDTVLKRYRVAAGSARIINDYLQPRDSSIIHDYRLPRDPSHSTILPSFTTTSASAIPLWISLPESRPATTIPLGISLPESPPTHTSRPSCPTLVVTAARHTVPHGVGR